MKVIDLLNKIANGEKVPEKIRYDNLIWKKTFNTTSKCNCYCNDYETDFLDYIFVGSLNDEIKVIEESKKIEKLNYLTSIITTTLNDEKQDIVSAPSNIEIADKLNEIIDYINKENKDE